MDKTTLSLFQQEGLSFEEINRITESEKQITQGKTLSKSEMKKFIKDELFANCQVHA